MKKTYISQILLCALSTVVAAPDVLARRRLSSSILDPSPTSSSSSYDSTLTQTPSFSYTAGFNSSITSQSGTAPLADLVTEPPKDDTSTQDPNANPTRYDGNGNIICETSLSLSVYTTETLTITLPSGVVDIPRPEKPPPYCQIYDGGTLDKGDHPIFAPPTTSTRTLITYKTSVDDATETRGPAITFGPADSDGSNPLVPITSTDRANFGGSGPTQTSSPPRLPIFAPSSTATQRPTAGTGRPPQQQPQPPQQSQQQPSPGQPPQQGNHATSAIVNDIPVFIPGRGNGVNSGSGGQAVVIGGSTFSNPGPTRTVRTVGGQAFTLLPSGGGVVVPGGMTIAPASPTTTPGNAAAAAPGAAVPPLPIATLGGVALGFDSAKSEVNVGGQVFGLPSAGEASRVVTVNGNAFTIGADGIVVGSEATVTLSDAVADVTALAAVDGTNDGDSTFLGTTIDGVGVDVGSTLAIVDGTTVLIGLGAETTSLVVDGDGGQTTVTAGPDGLVFPSTTLPPFTSGDSGSSRVVTIDGLVMTVGPDRVVVDGTTFAFATPTTAVVDGETLTIGPDGVEMPSTTIVPGAEPTGSGGDDGSGDGTGNEDEGGADEENAAVTAAGVSEVLCGAVLLAFVAMTSLL